MKVGIFLVLMGVIVSFLIANASGKTISLDSTDFGTIKDSDVIKIGEMKYNYEAQIYVKNTHDFCEIIITPGLYQYIDSEIDFNPFRLGLTFGWNITSETDIEWGGGAKIFLKPHEEVSLSIRRMDIVPSTELGINIRALFNESVYNEQQTDVRVHYTIKVYDDRDELIVDSEDASCCGQIIILGVGALLIIPLLIKRLNRPT